MRTHWPLVTLLMLALLACGGGYDYDIVQMPDGQEAVRVECGHRMDCYAAMGQRCDGRPYQVLDASGVRDEGVSNTQLEKLQGNDRLRAYRKRIQVVFVCLHRVLGPHR